MRGRKQPLPVLAGVLVLLAAIMSSPSWSAEAPIAGSTSVVLADFCRLAGQAMTPEQWQRVEDKYAHGDVSLARMREATTWFGLKTDLVQATWADLQSMRGPKIIELTDPPRLLVISRADNRLVQVLDSQQEDVRPTEEIAAHYAGRAVVLHQGSTHGPRLELKEFDHQFGAIGADEAVTHTFTLANIGDEPLVVHVQGCTKCGPLPAKLSKEMLAPGESADLRVDILAEGMASVPQSITQTVILVTTDEYDPVAMVSVRAVAPPSEIMLLPSRFIIRVDKNAEATRTAALSIPLTTKLVEVVSDSPRVRAVARELPEKDGKAQWAIDITALPNPTAGSFEHMVRIRTTYEKRPEITLRVDTRVHGELRTTPPSATFGQVKLRAKVTRELVITSSRGTAFNVTGVKTSTPEILVGTPRRHDGSWVIPVSVDASAAKTVSGAINIMTDVPGEENVTIPFYAQVTP